MHATGLRLTILAMAVQTVLVGTGGAVCLDDLRLPWMQAACADPRCETADDDCCPGPPGVAVASAPAQPAPPACCIGAPIDVWLPGRGSIEPAGPDQAPAAFAAAPALPARRCLKSATPSESRRPPPVRLVGVVKLQV